MKDEEQRRKEAAEFLDNLSSFLMDDGRSVDQIKEALQAQGRRAHRIECEAARVPGIDQLLLRRRGIGENADPAERIFAVVECERRFGNLQRGGRLRFDGRGRGFR